MYARAPLPQQPMTYTPAALIDLLKLRLSVKHDSDLAREMDVDPAVICRVRHCQAPLSGALVIRTHEMTGLSIAEIRAVVGDRRGTFRSRSRIRYDGRQLATQPNNVTPLRPVQKGTTTQCSEKHR